jgi:hypothetical protein
MSRTPLRCAVLILAGFLFGVPRANAAITITGYAFGSEGPAVSGATIEDFEDVNLLPGLTIRMGGSITTPRMWTGTLPRVWNPATATNCCTLGGPFPANTWDGTFALCNGGHGTGSTGLSGGLGNYWDFSFADSVYFIFNAPQQMVGLGLSNFQSLGGPTPVTNHELIVNGVSRGVLETLLPGYAPGVNVRFRYMVVTATAPDQINSICIQCITNLDGLVFDKLAVKDFSSPARQSTWGRIKADRR